MAKISRKRRQDFEKVANIVRDAGGSVIGRTRLQKVAYLLELAGLGEGFSFRYKHFGPYSEDLNVAAQMGDLLGALEEEEKIAKWGGSYSIYSTDKAEDEMSSSVRKELAVIASSADSIELELAATAAFIFSVEKIADAWQETARRKPEKATATRLNKAKQLYLKLAQIETPRRLPVI
jgi:uncharacterized protein YwgA